MITDNSIWWRTIPLGSSMIIKDNLIYIHSPVEFFVLDISDRNNIRKLGSACRNLLTKTTDISGDLSNNQRTGLDMHEQIPNIAYLFGVNGLATVDISNPLNLKVMCGPKFVKKYTNSHGSIKIADKNTAYIFGGDGFAVVDISKAEDIKILGSCNTKCTINAMLDSYVESCIEIVNKNYVAIYSINGFGIVDVTQRDDPKRVSILKGFCTGTGVSLVLEGGLAYVFGSYGIGCVDISSPLSIKKVGKIKTKIEKS